MIHRQSQIILTNIYDTQTNIDDIQTNIDNTQTDMDHTQTSIDITQTSIDNISTYLEKGISRKLNQIENRKPDRIKNTQKT